MQFYINFWKAALYQQNQEYNSSAENSTSPPGQVKAARFWKEKQNRGEKREELIMNKIQAGRV